MSIFILLLALAIWGFVHSFLASYLAKDLFRLRAGNSDFYRLAYNIFGVAWMPYYVIQAGNETVELPAFGAE